MDRDAYQQQYKDFGVRPFKVLGGIQIGLGLICAIMSMIVVGMDASDISKPCTAFYYGSTSPCFSRVFLACDITCLIFAGWIIMTGCLPFCMYVNNPEKWTCLKTAFMVCSILGSAIFIPTVVGLGTFGAMVRHYDILDDNWKAAFPAVVAVCGGIEMLVAIVSASYCCCCWKSPSLSVAPVPAFQISMMQQQQQQQQIS